MQKYLAGGNAVKDNVILDKTMDFSVRIVRLYQYLCDKKKEYVLSKQLLRAGTSIGANTHEAHNAQSDKDFLAKMLHCAQRSDRGGILDQAAATD